MSKPENLKFKSFETALQSVCDAQPADVDAAVNLMLSILNDDAQLYRDVAGPLVTAAVREAVREEVRRRRQQAYRSPDADSKGRSDVEALAAVKTRTLMDTAMTCVSKLLRDATKDEVLKDAHMYESFAAGNAREARWRRLIVKHWKGDAATVGQAMDEGVLRNLREQVK